MVSLASRKDKKVKNYASLTMLDYMLAVRSRGMFARESLKTYGYTYGQINAMARRAEQLGYIEYDITDYSAEMSITGKYVFPEKFR